MPSQLDVEILVAETVRANIEEIRGRIVSACRRAGREEREITLIAVSKTFPTSVVRAAAEEGILDFGENRVQELIQKASDMPGIRLGGLVRWHMIGRLQRNKAKDVVRVADLFHGMDSERLARELNTKAEQDEIKLPYLIQVNTSAERSKAGVAPDEVPQLLDAIAELSNLEPLGFMTIAAPVDDPEEVRAEFRLLREIRDRAADLHPQFRLNALSMGMSHDFEVAIEEGATHIRIGSAIFGARG